MPPSMSSRHIKSAPITFSIIFHSTNLQITCHSRIHLKCFWTFKSSKSLWKAHTKAFANWEINGKFHEFHPYTVLSFIHTRNFMQFKQYSTRLFLLLLLWNWNEKKKINDRCVKKPSLICSLFFFFFIFLLVSRES